VANKPTPHPAKFSDEVIRTLSAIFTEHNITGTGFHPFAGVSKGVELLESDQRYIIGLELEPEWAEQKPGTVTGDVLKLFSLGFKPSMFDFMFWSPAYGNRMADHHVARDDSRRHTYTHYIGRQLNENNSGAMQWGDEYRKFHQDAYKRMLMVVKPGGWIVLNVSDHVRKGEVQKVSAWHKGTLARLGVEWLPGSDGIYMVGTRRNRHGTNGEVRMLHEWVFVGRKKVG